MPRRLEIVDSTLREGAQGGARIFRSNAAARQYCQEVISSGFADKLEVYLPGIYMPTSLFGSLIGQFQKHLNIYCGTVEDFQFVNRPELSEIPASTLSLTVLQPNLGKISKLRWITSRVKETTLRLGIECAYDKTDDVLLKTIRRFDQLPEVTHITLSDSNGKALPERTRHLLDRLPATSAVIGFHFHNDRGLAMANAWEVLASRGRRKHSLDCTFNGLGERNGILSIQEIVATTRRGGRVAMKEQLITQLSKHFTQQALAFNGYPLMGGDKKSAAKSHFRDGRLRREYR